MHDTRVPRIIPHANATWSESHEIDRNKERKSATKRMQINHPKRCAVLYWIPIHAHTLTHLKPSWLNQGHVGPPRRTRIPGNSSKHMREVVHVCVRSSKQMCVYGSQQLNGTQLARCGACMDRWLPFCEKRNHGESRRTTPTNESTYQSMSGHVHGRDQIITDMSTNGRKYCLLNQCQVHDVHGETS